MGYWLRDRIKTWSGVTDTDVQRLNLPKTGILSAIQIRAHADRSATARAAGDVCRHLCQDIDKLEVIETGSKILKSIDGTMCLAHNLHDFKRPTESYYSEQESDDNHDNYFLLFGRHVMDPLFALDLAKHKDAKLEISHSLDTTTKTGFTTKTLDFEIFIWRYMAGTLPIQGYFKTSEKFHYTAAEAKGEVRKELPCLNPIRRIYIRPFLRTNTPGACITDLELVVNDGEYSPFFGVPMRMAAADVVVHGLNPFWSGEVNIAAVVGSYETETWISYRPFVSLADKAGEDAPAIIFSGTQAGNIILYQTTATAQLADLRVRGYAHQYALCIPFDVPDVPESYFPTRGLGKLELVINQLAKKADTRIVLDEFVKY